ncbi:MAG: matrixin family metalloprotease [Candidatus Brocadiales bacterium]|nr:matrixin family metalloprotease [Candidatus Brocadiales bacterium]
MKRIQFILFLLVISILSFWCSSAFAYRVKKTKDGKIIKWTTNTVTYYVNTSGGPAGSLAAIQAATQTWTDVPTSSFRFVYGGHTSSTKHNPKDGVNIIYFRTLGNKAKAARNFVQWNESGELYDSDIVLNTAHKLSATDSCPKDCFDIQSAVTHELGHALILNELEKPIHNEKTMYREEKKGDMKKRTLDQDDIAGITYLYP